jgi:hypothetical protein
MVKEIQSIACHWKLTTYSLSGSGMKLNTALRQGDVGASFWTVSAAVFSTAISISAPDSSSPQWFSQALISRTSEHWDRDSTCSLYTCHIWPRREDKQPKSVIRYVKLRQQTAAETRINLTWAKPTRRWLISLWNRAATTAVESTQRPNQWVVPGTVGSVFFSLEFFVACVGDTDHVEIYDDDAHVSSRPIMGDAARKKGREGMTYISHAAWKRGQAIGGPTPSIDPSSSTVR